MAPPIMPILCIEATWHPNNGAGVGAYIFDEGTRITTPNKGEPMPPGVAQQYALWFAQHGGRALLDAFELLAAGRGWVGQRPAGRKADKWHAQRLVRAQSGGEPLVEWVPLFVCKHCDDAAADEDDGLCSACDGTGWITRPEVLATLDGRIVPKRVAYADQA